MYNWSVDEKKFKNIKEIIDFLKKQPEVISTTEESKKDRWGNSVIKVKLDSDIHPVRKTFLEHFLDERIGKELRVSIIEAKKLKKEIFK